MGYIESTPRSATMQDQQFSAPPPYHAAANQSLHTISGVRRFEPIPERREESMYAGSSLSYSESLGSSIYSDVSDSSSSPSPATVTSDYDDSYMHDPAPVFGPEVDRVESYNSVNLPVPRVPDNRLQRYSNPLSPYPPQFHKQVNTRNYYTPFRPIVMVANSQRLAEGFPKVYFPDQLGSHDITSSDWQRFLLDLERLEMQMNSSSCVTLGGSSNRNCGRIANRNGSSSLLGSVWLGDHDTKGPGDPGYGKFSQVVDDRLHNGRRGKKRVGLIGSALKLGAQYIDAKSYEKQTRRGMETSQPSFLSQGTNGDQFYTQSIEDSHSALTDFIEKWNEMFFNSRCIHVQLKFPNDVQNEYNQLMGTSNKEDARRIRRQAERDGPNSLNKFRLIIRSL